jgi:hypothetical protein
MVLRLSWEFNGNWYYWSVGSNVDAFKGCWSKAVKALRTTANAVTIDWNWNGHYSQSCNHNIYSCYPGDDVVDIVGIDSYDMYPSSGSSNESWAAYCRASGEGLCNAADFARQHGKMISVPEWGISNQSENPGVRGKDNPAYMQNMYNFFTANKDIMAYESYYNAPLSVEPGNVGSGIWPGASVDGVNASAKYKQLFGK